VIGVHTCDKRATRTYLAETYTSFNIEPGFTEDDQLWTATYRETDAEKATRLRKVLDQIFSSDSATCKPPRSVACLHELMIPIDISITAHGGAISAIFTDVNHIPYSVSTGGIYPFYHPTPASSNEFFPIRCRPNRSEGSAKLVTSVSVLFCMRKMYCGVLDARIRLLGIYSRVMHLKIKNDCKTGSVNCCPLQPHTHKRSRQNLSQGFGRNPHYD
jgi:hypothetical protein